MTTVDDLDDEDKVLWIRNWDDLKELWERDSCGCVMGIGPKQFEISFPEDRYIRFHPRFPDGDLEYFGPSRIETEESEP